MKSEKGISKAPKTFVFGALAVANHYDASCFLVYRTLLGLVLFVICLTSFGAIFLLSEKRYCAHGAAVFYSRNTTAAGHITRRNRMSLHRNNTIKLKKHLQMQVLFLAVANHYDATLFFEKSRFFRAFSKKLYPPEVLINIISERDGFFNSENTGMSL